MFSLIAAVGKNHELGQKGQLVFHLQNDMNFFRQTTNGHKVVMGRKTWESLPSKLKNRENIVISHQNFSGPDQIIHDVDDFIKKNQATNEEIFIIGGGAIYSVFLPHAKNLYLTEINASAPTADTFFPNFDKTKYQKTLITKGTENGLEYSIVKYTKD